MGDLPLAMRRFPAPSLGAFDLPLADVREDGAEMLVLDDACLGNLAQLVKGAIGQVKPTVTDGKPAVGVIDNGDPLADLAGSRGSKTKIESPEFFCICETSHTRDGRITLWLMQRQ